MLEGRRGALAIAALSLVPLLPALGQPFTHDDLNSIYQAAVCLRNPAHLADPWMGGLWRFVPKLLLVGLLGVAGPVSWVFRLHGYLWHAASVYLIARAFGRPAGPWAAALFAAGLGWYAAAVIQVSNVTMLTALALLLAAWRAHQLGRNALAALSLTLAALCHEAAWAGVLFLPLARRPRVLAAVLLAFVVALVVPGWPRTYAWTEMQYWFFALLPLNALPGAMARAGEIAVAIRPWAGIGICLGLAALAWRARGTWALAAAWMVVFTLPFAAAITFWPEVWPAHWLDRRYLYAPAVGVCLLAATWLTTLGIAWRRWAVVALIGWSLAWTGLRIWSAGQEAMSPSQVEARAEWARDMAAVDPRWRR